MSRAMLPEYAGSYTSKVAELMRLDALPAKLAAKDRRIQKKIDRARRKAEERRKNLEKNMPSNDTSQRKTRVVTANRPLPKATCEFIRGEIRRRGKDVVESIFAECSPWTNPGGIRSEVSKLLHAENDSAKHGPKRVAALMLLADRLRRGDSPKPKMPEAIIRAAVAPGVSEDLLRAIQKVVNDSLDNKLEGFARLEAKPADVDRRLHMWENIKTCINSASKEDKKHGARWRQLRSTFEVEHHELMPRARELGIDPDGEGWMRQLVVKEPVEFVTRLHDIASRLFARESRSAASQG